GKGGGQAVEPGNDLSRARPPGSDHRREPADADQAGEPEEVDQPARRRPVDAGSRAERDLGSIRSASRREDAGMTSQAVIVVNQLGVHAPAAAKFLHLAARFAPNAKAPP